MMVKKTWRKRLTAFIRTAMRYSHASPDMMTDVDVSTFRALDRYRRCSRQLVRGRDGVVCRNLKLCLSARLGEPMEVKSLVRRKTSANGFD